MIDDIRLTASAFMQKHGIDGENWVIAGGAIRDALLGRIPKDIDIFILGLPEMSEEREILYDKLASLYEPENKNYLGPVLTENFIPDTSISENIDPQEQGVKIQVMFSEYKTIEELIKSFDWNISWIGMNKDGLIHDPCDLANTINAVPLTLLNITNPFSNLRRGYRFSERYGTQIDAASLLTLVTKVKDALEKSGKNTVGNLDPIPYKTEEVF